MRTGARTAIGCAAVVLAALMGTAAPAAAADGELDPSFGSGGIAASTCGERLHGGGDVAVQPDGRVVVVGSVEHYPSLDSEICVSRFNTDGSPDLSFGSFGTTVRGAGSGWTVGLAVSLMPDGRIVIAGAYGTPDAGTTGVVVMRLAADGDRDPAFGGGDGVALEPVGWGARQVAVTPDGSILAAGHDSLGDTTDPVHHFAFAVLKLKADGARDTSFGDDGVASQDTGGGASVGGLALQPDGRVVVSGEGTGQDGLNDLIAVRWNADGTLDTTFGENGMAEVGFGGTERGGALALRPDGGMWLAGAGRHEEDAYLAFARLDAGGRLDDAFSGDGRQMHGVTGSPSVSDAVIGVDGKLVVTGSTGRADRPSDAVVAKILSNGALDPSFAGDGVQTVPIGPGGQGDDIALALDGRLVALGTINRESPSAEFRLIALEDSLPALSVSDTSAVEGSGSAFFRLTLDKPSGEPLRVAFTTRDGTASAGADYLARSGTLTFQPGETSKTYGVPVLGDALAEGDETFELVASPLDGAATAGDAGVATIVDAPAGGPPTVPTAPQPLPGPCANLLRGTGLGESLIGSPFGDEIRAAGGDDRVSGGDGRDCLYGGKGNDRVSGGDGADLVAGQSGDDSLRGGPGNDRLVGGPGDDRIDGGEGKNRVDAGTGDDRVAAANGRAETIDCGPGRDRVRADRTDRLRGCESVRRSDDSRG